MSRIFEEVKFHELVTRYCKTQEAEEEDVTLRLYRQLDEYDPDGFMLLVCEMMDSSLLGSHTILPFGPNNTFKVPPDHPISPRGRASDMSVVECVHWVKPEKKPK